MAELELSRMAHLEEIVDQQEDNWTGVTDSKERRKRQNRLHQRAWRRRQAAEREARHGGGDNLPDREGVHIIRLDKPAPPSSSSKEPRAAPALSSPSPVQVLASSDPETSGSSGTAGAGQARNNSVAVRPRQHYLYSSSDRSPLTTAIHSMLRSVSGHQALSTTLGYFPLSPDHKLIALVQYNVLRGMQTNVMIMSLQHELSLDCDLALRVPALPYSTSERPPNFAPTLLQQTVQYPRWIDIVPHPQLRDNLILFHGQFDEDDLCDDLVGGLYDGFDDVQLRGMMIWGAPWAEDGWEISEGFIRKWGFLLTGCETLLRATNRWRELRGERRLRF